ncbi:MAG: hypothetical protein HY799_02630 [Nitrosomonadales bacterium]|nr:hypothetical protein [Nitrosomonadales bacterium]
MRIIASAIVLLVSCLLPAFAAVDADGYNEFTIRPTDIPSDSPRFEDYPASIYAGNNAPPKFNDNPSAKQFRGQLSHWARSKPNFAGHYILATWGCGTDCVSITVIDTKTGNIYFPDGMTTNVSVNVHERLLDGNELWHQPGSVKFQADSRLLILIGMPEERAENRGISFYVWENNKFKQVRHIHKSWYPESK